MRVNLLVFFLGRFFQLFDFLLLFSDSIELVFAYDFLAKSIFHEIIILPLQDDALLSCFIDLLADELFLTSESGTISHTVDDVHLSFAELNDLLMHLNFFLLISNTLPLFVFNILVELYEFLFFLVDFGFEVSNIVILENNALVRARRCLEIKNLPLKI